MDDGDYSGKALMDAIQSLHDATALGFQKSERRMDRIEEQINRRFEQVDMRFERLEDQMNRRFDRVDERFDQFEARVAALEQGDAS